MTLADRPQHAVRVLPPEAATRQGLRAGVVSRTAVMVVDAGYVAALVGVAYGLWAGVRLLRDPRAFTWPQVSYVAIVSFALFVAVLVLTVSWTTTGRSPGARLMGLRLLGPDDAPPRLGRSLLRAIICVAFPLGLFWSAFSRRNASVQDLLTRTSVVYDWHDRNWAGHPQTTRSGPA